MFIFAEADDIIKTTFTNVPVCEILKDYKLICKNISKSNLKDFSNKINEEDSKMTTKNIFYNPDIEVEYRNNEIKFFEDFLLS